MPYLLFFYILIDVTNYDSGFEVCQLILAQFCSFTNFSLVTLRIYWFSSDSIFSFSIPSIKVFNLCNTLSFP